MIHKAWCSIEEVPYYFSMSYINFQGHTGWKIDELDQIWARLLGRSQLSNPSDLPCFYYNSKFKQSTYLDATSHSMAACLILHERYQPAWKINLILVCALSELVSDVIMMQKLASHHCRSVQISSILFYPLMSGSCFKLQNTPRWIYNRFLEMTFYNDIL